MDSKNLYIVAAAASLALSLAHYFGVGFTANADTAVYIGLSLGNLLAKKGK